MAKRIMAKNNYTVIVGNIGTVYDGGSKKDALKDFREYVADSQSGRGRAGGESVTLFENGHPVKEFVGENDE